MASPIGAVTHVVEADWCSVTACGAVPVSSWCHGVSWRDAGWYDLACR